MSHHDVVQRAAAGGIPEWAVASEERLAHMNRVSALLGEWAGGMGLSEDEAIRWRAAGHLHDVLRDEHEQALRDRVPMSLRGLPGPLLHGPAAAELLRAEGVLDGELLNAVAFHTVGSASFGPLGRALYAADFLEPGRAFLPEWREELRARLPSDLDDVVREVVRARLGNLLERGAPLLPQTVAFWNGLVT